MGIFQVLSLKLASVYEEATSRLAAYVWVLLDHVLNQVEDF
jgi:hypothetical protein